MRGLGCCLAVPSDGGARSQGYAHYTGELLMLYGDNGLVAREEQGQPVMVAGHVLDCPALRSRFHPFLPPKGLL
eukprot:1775954-Rhodomonas_salina.1